MGAKDAVYAMENCGLRVTLAGKGRVTAQSVRPGSHVTTKQTVTLTLKE
jgi:cell division protein FtsI (penicillin-binding protein 3)